MSLSIFTELEITQDLKISNDLEILQNIDICGNILMSGVDSTLNLKTIKSNRSTNIDPCGNYVDISGSALLVPRGTTASRMSTDGSATAKAGMIMYDTDQKQFVGVIDGTSELVWTGLGGVISTDQKTRIEATNDGTNNSGLKFFTNTLGNNYNMCINENGNVGIGNAMSSANDSLTNASDLNLFTNTESSFLISNTNIGLLTGGLKLTFHTDGNAEIYNTYSEGDLIFGTSNVKRMRILANGNVGIGTDLPTAKLQVNGDISGTKLSLNDGLSNTIVGYQALEANTTGANNTANGYQALFSNTTGRWNTAIGFEALYKTTGNGNTAIGFEALYNTTIDGNTAIGYQALFTNTIGWDNTAIGYQALYKNTGYGNTGYGNTAIGSYSLNSNTTGANNTAIGSFSLYMNTTGANNTVNGNQALFNNTTGSNNTAIGYQAGKVNSYDKDNTICIGADSSVTESNMCCIGNPSLPMSVGIGTSSPDKKLHISGDGGSDAAIKITSTNSSGDGYMYLQRNTNGAAYVLNTGSYPLILATNDSNGSSANQLYLKEDGNVGIDTPSPSYKLDVNGEVHVKTVININAGSDGLYLNYDQIRRSGTGILYIQYGDSRGHTCMNETSGNVGIGTRSPSYKLHVNGTFFASTSIETDGDITAFAASDKRLKNNITPIQNPLEKLKKINGYTFDWIEKKDIHSNKGNDIGVIAQEIEEVLPEITTTRDNGYKAVRYEKLTPFLISCIKDQQTQIQSLQSQIDELKELIKK